MKTLVCLLVILIISADGFSQWRREIDSLNTLINTNESKDAWWQSNVYARLGWLHNNIRQYDSGVYFYEQALKIAPKDSRENWLANAHLGLGFSFSALDEWDSAFINYQTALSIYKTLGDTDNIAIVHGNLSLLYISKGLYEEALSNSFQAISVLERTPSFALGTRYNNIAMIYKSIKNYPDADIYFRKSILVFLKLDKKLDIAKSYNNLGELFILQKKYDSAKVNLQKSFSIKEQLDDTKGMAHTQTNLGKVSMLTGNFQLAETQLTESLATQRRINDAVGMIETLNNLGELYLSTERHSLASSALQEASAIIHHSGTPDYLRQNLELRIKLARKEKDFATGMTLQDELLIIRDSLLNEEKSKSLQAMQIRFETQKKEQAIALLQQREEINNAKIRSNQILIVSLIIGIILIAAIGALIYINLRNTRAARQRIELLLSETRHRIKNHLQMLASVFHLQARNYTDQAMVLEAQSSESRVHTISLLHEKFCVTEDNVINTREYVTDLVNKLVGVYRVSSKNLKVFFNVEEVDLDIDKALALSMIIQELVCNAFKYAFDREPNPELAIEIRNVVGDVHTIIQDNGIGFSRNLKSKSQGLNLVDALVSQLDGEMKVENNHGTKFTISFPGTSLWKRHAF